MANYESVVLSNQVRVKKPQELIKVLETLGFDEWSITGEDVITFGSTVTCFDIDQMNVVRDEEENVIGVSSDFMESPELLDDNISVEEWHEQPFTEYIQEQLYDENQFLYVKEIGHEKLRYVVATGCVITKTDIRWFDIDSIVNNYLKSSNLPSIL